MFSNSETFSEYFYKLIGIQYSIFLNAVIQYILFLVLFSLTLYGLMKILSFLGSDYEYVITIFAGAGLSIAVIVVMFTISFIGLIAASYSITCAIIGIIVLFGLMYSGQLKQFFHIESYINCIIG